MADVTFKHFDDLDSHSGMFLYAAQGLGVTSWGMNILKLPAGWDGYPDHDHAEDGQEEAYVALAGTATLRAGDETWTLEPGTLARVAPAQKRKIVPGDQGVTLLVIGGIPGKPYVPPKR
jgi:uncharacterized cupin superfamily protein